jgi:hypothetical protein
MSFGMIYTGGRRARTTFRRSAASHVCRWCGRSTEGGRAVVEHYDYNPGGVHWAEHLNCRRQKPSRDWLAPPPKGWLP